MKQSLSTRALLAFGALLTTAPLFAQGAASLVRDITTVAPSVNPNGQPRDFFVFGSSMLFRGSTDATGGEMWRTDGTPGGTFPVIDINPGPADSSLWDFTEITPGVFLFQATNVSVGQELWRTDGTAAGTSLVKNIRPGALSSMQFPDIVALGGIGYFSATDSATSTADFELWRSDGTAAGTFRVKDINPSASSSPNGLTVIGSTLHFWCNDGTNGTELYKSDGTDPGTVLVANINPGSASGSPTNPAVLGGLLYFSATEPVAGRELYRTDGTTTTLVADINPGMGSGNPTGLVVFGSHVYFTANDGTSGSELWRSDGTTTAMVANINPAAASSFPGFLTVSGSNLFFQANDGTNGTELWATDGTTTAMVRDINNTAAGASSSPNRLYDAGGTLVFTADDGSGIGVENYRSDGTLLGTYLLADINPTPAGSTTDRWQFFNGFVYFPAADDTNLQFNTGQNQELWRSDTVVGASLFKDLNPPTPSSNPVSIVDSRGVQTAIFGADDGVNGLELWKSDGTFGGTVLIKDINPGATGAVIGNLLAVSDLLGNRVFFTADDGVAGRELWVTDGTTGGTVMLEVRAGATGSNPFNLVEFKGQLFFAAGDGVNGTELWKSDGTVGGTTMVADIRMGSSSSSPSGLVVVNQTLFFSANDGTNGTELWKSDGTAGGTVMVANISAGSGSSSPSQLVAYQDRLFFRANSGSGNEPWMSDGTAGGTALLKDINTSTGTASSNPLVLGIANGLLFFRATEPASGDELWKTDGTTLGTVLVKDIAPGIDNGSPTQFAAIGNVAVFIANDGVTGYEPWRTDGTTAGTFQVADVRPGALGCVTVETAIGWMTAIQGSNRALFAASDGVSGVEIWRTDGTAGGTVLHQDISSGAANSNPSLPVQAGCLLFFAATDGANGTELYAMTSTASSTVFGQSCPGTGGKFPHISGSGAPTIGNAGYGIRVTNGLIGSAAVALIQTGRAAIPLGGGCTFYLGGAFVTSRPVPLLDGTGSGIATLPIPANISLACVEVYAQHFVLDAGGSWNIFSLTEGMKILLNVN